MKFEVQNRSQFGKQIQTAIDELVIACIQESPLKTNSQDLLSALLALRDCVDALESISPEVRYTGEGDYQPLVARTFKRAARRFKQPTAVDVTPQTRGQKAKLDRCMRIWAKKCKTLRFPKPGDPNYESFLGEHAPSRRKS